MYSAVKYYGVDNAFITVLNAPIGMCHSFWQGQVNILNFSFYIIGLDIYVVFL